jgi:DNA replication protein DnaC
MKTERPNGESGSDGHLAYERLHQSLETLKLPTVEAIADGYLSSTAAEGRSTVEVLDYLVGEEVKARLGQSEQMRLKMGARQGEYVQTVCKGFVRT